MWFRWAVHWLAFFFLFYLHFRNSFFLFFLACFLFIYLFIYLFLPSLFSFLILPSHYLTSSNQKYLQPANWKSPLNDLIRRWLINRTHFFFFFVWNSREIRTHVEETAREGGGWSALPPSADEGPAGRDIARQLRLRQPTTLLLRSTCSLHRRVITLFNISDQSLNNSNKNQKKKWISKIR